MNTQCPRPHGLSELSSVSFSPLPTPSSSKSGSGSGTLGPYLLTTALDGTAKLWQILQAKKSEHGKLSHPISSLPIVSTKMSNIIT